MLVDKEIEKLKDMEFDLKAMQELHADKEIQENMKKRIKRQREKLRKLTNNEK